MSGMAVSDQPHTAAILLGASTFPLHGETYAPNPAFLVSKQEIRSYLQDATGGLALTDAAICDLFDQPQLPSQQLVTIGRFLEGIGKDTDAQPLRNLIVYYVGHGFFAGSRQEYHVALACLEMGYESSTGLRLSDLAEVLKERARSYRRFVILDCCFAAEALREFQGAAEDAVFAQAKGAFATARPRRPQPVPTRGTALLCAADKDHVARSPRELKRTLFTDALLAALRSGDQRPAPYLTFSEISDLVWDRLQLDSNPVRPVLHSPDQSEGDIAEIVQLFPNPHSTAVVETPRVESVMPPAAGLRPLAEAPGNIEDTAVSEIILLLTRLIGPIAPVLVKKVRPQAQNLPMLTQLIAQALEADERGRFLAAVQRLANTRR